MTQKHVELLLKALAVPESCSIYLCDRIRFVTGYYPDEIDQEYIEEECCSEGEDLVQMIRENIDNEFSFDYTQYAKDGMTREQWVKEILVPIALKLE